MLRRRDDKPTSFLLPAAGQVRLTDLRLIDDKVFSGSRVPDVMDGKAVTHILSGLRQIWRLA